MDDKYKDARNAASLRYHKRERALDPVKYMLYRAKSRCNKKGIPFDLTVNDLVIPTHCPVLGYQLDYTYSFTKGTKGPRPPNVASLDRIIPSLGYVRGNVIIVSLRANVLKNDASIEEMEKVVKYYKYIYSNT